MNNKWTSNGHKRGAINILILSPLIQESQIATSVPTNIRNRVYLAGRNDATLPRLFHLTTQLIS